MKFEIKNRWTGGAQFTAEIDCEKGSSLSVKVGLAVRWALKNNADLRYADLSGADLSGADLSGADLRYADLRYADLSGADLRYADLRYADLSGADLSGADLSGADLSGADLSGADLSGADLSGADLSGADLSGADLSGADLSGAKLSGADLSGADLSGAKLSGAKLREYSACLWMTLTQNPHEVPALIDALKNGRVDGSQYEGECACLVGTIAKSKGVSHRTLHYRASDPSEQWFSMIRPGDTPDKDTGGGFAAKMALQWIADWQLCQAPATPTKLDTDTTVGGE